MGKTVFRLRNALLTISALAVCPVILLMGSCEKTMNSSITDNCVPTAYDEIGPFYRPNAPVRNKVGTGYLLQGRVLSTDKCRPLPHAQLEFWLVNPRGSYDDDHRATVIADNSGKYSFESNRPTEYVGRLPHIHMRITAQGHEELITQHYPKEGASGAEFDIVLPPASK